MPIVYVNGINLYYEERGSGPPLLFIHGMAGSAEVWSDQMRRLSDRFRCIAYDRRGHTRSARGSIDHETVELHADDAAGLTRALGLAPVILVGSSGGARIVVDVLRRYSEFVRGAVLSEPPLFGLAPGLAADFLSKVKPGIENALASDNPASAVDAFFRVADPVLWETIPEERREMFRANLSAMLGDLKQPPYQVTLKDLAKVNRPCLMFYGSLSEKPFIEIAKMVASAIPNCCLVELKGAGHATYFHRPAEFAAAVREFALSLPGVKSK